MKSFVFLILLCLTSVCLSQPIPRTYPSPQTVSLPKAVEGVPVVFNGCSVINELKYVTTTVHFGNQSSKVKIPVINGCIPELKEHRDASGRVYQRDFTYIKEYKLSDYPGFFYGKPPKKESCDVECNVDLSEQKAAISELAEKLAKLSELLDELKKSRSVPAPVADLSAQLPAVSSRKDVDMHGMVDLQSALKTPEPEFTKSFPTYKKGN